MVKIIREGDVRKLKLEGESVEDAIFQLGVSPQTVLSRLNGEFVPDDKKLKNGDSLELKRISSIG